MGIRYFIELEHCNVKQEAYYAPTCSFFTHRCEVCQTEIDLEEVSGIPAESTASSDAGLETIAAYKEGR